MSLNRTNLKTKHSNAEFRRQLFRLRSARRRNKYGTTVRQRALESFIYNVGRYIITDLQNHPIVYRLAMNSLVDAIIEYSAFTTEFDRLGYASISKYVLQILDRSREDLRMKVPPEIYARSVAAVKGFTFEERIYAKKTPYDFYRDFLGLVQTATNELAIADAYASEDMLTLYVDKVQPGVNIRILTSRPKQSFIAVAQKFKQKADVLFEVRESTDFHDRFAFVDASCWVFGQSVSAAGAKPTYLLRVKSYHNMRDIFEDLWIRAALLV